MNQRISLKINFLYLSAFNLCVFSGFFLTGITSMSPIYYAFLLAVLFFGLQIILLPFVKVKECIYEYIPLFLYIVYIILNAILWDTALKYPLLIALSAFYYFFSNVVLGPLSSLQIRKIIRWFIYLTFFLLIIECSYRIMHPSHFKWVTGDNFFYVFKFNSIMFTDSNEVGFLIMIFLGFLNYLKRECSIRFPFYLYIITFILLLLTFSRAALLGFLFSFFMINIYSQARLLYKLFVVGIGVIGGMYLLQYFLADGSFFTKL